METVEKSLLMSVEIGKTVCDLFDLPASRIKRLEIILDADMPVEIRTVMHPVRSGWNGGELVDVLQRYQLITKSDG